MADLIEKHQLAAKLFEFTSLQHLADEQVERHSPVFRGQNKVLVALSEGDNISQKELAERLEMSVQSTAEFVTKLVKKDFVTKTKSPTDGRIQLIKLTEKGRREADCLSVHRTEGRAGAVNFFHSILTFVWDCIY